MSDEHLEIVNHRHFKIRGPVYFRIVYDQKSLNMHKKLFPHSHY